MTYFLDKLITAVVILLCFVLHSHLREVLPWWVSCIICGAIAFVLFVVFEYLLSWYKRKS